MMGENLLTDSLYDILDSIAELKIDRHNKQSVSLFNKVIAVAELSSSTLILTTKKILDRTARSKQLHII